MRLSKQKLEQLRTTGLLVEVDGRGRITVPNGKPNWRYRMIGYNDGTIVMEPLGPITDISDPEGSL